MPLRTDLLEPIPGANPSGEDLRYDAIYDKIKEARREDDEAPQGDWARSRKTADWALVVRLASEALATKTKDLQIAAWLTEAILWREGYSGFRSGLELIVNMIEQFWDTVYPEIEDGDCELRAAPLGWLGSKLDIAVKKVPLNKAGHDWLRYTDSQKLGYESACEGDYDKLKARSAQIEEGRMAPEDFDASFNATSKPFYKDLAANLAGSLELLAKLDDFCNERFGDVAPSFGNLRKALEEVQHTAAALLKKKLEKDPDPIEEQPETPSASEGAASASAGYDMEKVVGVLTPKPSSREDAIARIVTAASYIRGLDPAHPAPYLMLRGFRWGEVRATAPEIEPRLLEAPSTPTRIQLKSLMLDQKWPELLEACEIAMGTPCGRGWIDLQRYAITAAANLGHAAVELALKQVLGAYLADMPEIVSMTMMDDTPTANAETQQWLSGVVPEGAAHAIATPPSPPSPAMDRLANEAMDLAKAGRTQEAIALITRLQSQERSARGRFLRKTQLAAILVETSQDAIATPILEELLAHIDSAKLEEWESGEMVARPLALLYQCMYRSGYDESGRQNLYLRICRLDPLQAMACPQ